MVEENFENWSLEMPPRYTILVIPDVRLFTIVKETSEIRFREILQNVYFSTWHSLIIVKQKLKNASIFKFFEIKKEASRSPDSTEASPDFCSSISENFDPHSWLPGKGFCDPEH